MGALAANQNVFIGRQPVFNNNLGVIAYEFLFRSAAQKYTDVDLDATSAQVVMNLLVDMGLDRLSAGRDVYINVSETLLHKILSLPVEPSKLIIEIPEGLPVNEENLVTIKELSARGARIALDDFVFRTELFDLLTLAHIVKIDTNTLDERSVKRLLKAFKKARVKTLAKNVIDIDQYRELQQLGFDYYQGNMLGKPRVFKTKTLAPNRLSVLRLLATLYNPNTQVEEIVNIINQDVNLSYKLLKIVNCAFFGLPKKIDSLQQAVVILGRNEMTSWASLMAMSNLDDRPTELMRVALIRAKACELLGLKTGNKSASEYFTAGMFSALDVLMERPLDVLLDGLPLSSSIKRALLCQTGPLGAAIKCAIAYEEARFTEAGFESLPTWEITDANLRAMQWATDVMDALLLMKT